MNIYNEYVNFESVDAKSDSLYMKNVLTGKINNSKIYPLIFLDKEKSGDLHYRTLDFISQIIVNPKLYESLELEQKIYFGVGVRDLYLAVYMKIQIDAIYGLKDLLNQFMELEIECQDQTLECNGLKFSYFPFNNMRMLRYIDPNIITLPTEYEPMFACKESGHFMVFIDPRELSYHNFENIIPMDNFVPKFNNEQILQSVKKHNNLPIYFLNFENKCELNDLILNFDKMNLYVPPLNKDSRGGKRFIYHSKTLADYLTNIINTNKRNLPFLKDFLFVNNVFRLNKFSPTDRKFETHYDTPYYDKSRGHVSKYTLLLYTSTNNNCEDTYMRIFGKDNIFEIKSNFCNLFGVIMRQDLEHEGLPLSNSDKIFIRTELIFKTDENLQYNNDISKIFNSACYFEKEGVFDQDLTKYASKLFNVSAQMHLCSNTKTTKVNKLYLLKSFGPKYCEDNFVIEYITDGTDFIFDECIDYRVATMATIIDYFNVKSSEEFTDIEFEVKTLKKIPCNKSVRHHSSEFYAWQNSNEKRDTLCYYCKYYSNMEGYSGSLTCTCKCGDECYENMTINNISYSDDNNFPNGVNYFVEPKCNIEWIMSIRPPGKFHKYIYGGCCSFHDADNVIRMYSDDHLENCEVLFDMDMGLKDKKYRKFEKTFSNYQLVIFDKVVGINFDSIKMRGDKIYIKSKSGQLPTINFASCRGGFIYKDETGTFCNMLLPPILVRKIPGKFILSCLFFTNDYMVDFEKEEKCGPMIDDIYF